MARVLHWGYIDSCKLYFASLQDGDVRHDYFLTESTNYQPPNPNVWRCIVLKSNSTVRAFYDATSFESAMAMAERAAQCVVKDAIFNDRPEPLTVEPSEFIV